jgi:predicted SAM-dependent methyltransferase
MPFPDGAFAEIRAVDVLEHLSYWRTEVALAEWARLLAPGGRLYVQIPDCRRIMEEWIANPDRWLERIPPELEGLPPIVSIAWRILGGHDDGKFTQDNDDWRYNAHYAMFDEQSIGWYLDRAGLDVDTIESNFHPNLLVWAVKR